MPRVWDGSQWQELAVTLPDLSNYSTTTQMNTAIDNAKGLVLITTATIGTAVSSVTVNNAFSSTYDNYKVMISGGSAAANTQLILQLGSTNTGYYYTYVVNPYGSNASTPYGRTNYSSILVGFASTNTINCNLEIEQPNLAKNTSFHTTYNQTFTTGETWRSSGYLNNTTQYTSFTIFPENATTLTGGTIRVYGYRNS